MMAGLTNEGKRLINLRDRERVNIYRVRQHTIYLYPNDENNLYDLLAAGFADNKQDIIRRALAEAASKIRRFRHR